MPIDLIEDPRKKTRGTPAQYQQAFEAVERAIQKGGAAFRKPRGVGVERFVRYLGEEKGWHRTSNRSAEMGGWRICFAQGHSAFVVERATN